MTVLLSLLAAAAVATGPGNHPPASPPTVTATEAASSNPAERPSATVQPAAGSAYLAELVARARARHLADSLPWRRLGHWRGKLLGGVESQADGPGFFLSPRGKGDPEAELEATLRAFFEPAPPEPSAVSAEGEAEGEEDSRRAGKEGERAATAGGEAEPAPAAPSPGKRLPLGEKPVDALSRAHQESRPEKAKAAPEHPQCRFPARLAYLAGALDLDWGRLPRVPCPRFEAFWNRLEPRSVALVFSSYYLNNPASAFGHTFLRVGKTGSDDTAERFDLIDQGVDFAATVDTGNAILYAIKGFTGLFRGEFTARPYFYKVREYADFESRDLWQYELALTPGEVAMLVAHLWELGHTWFDYYYLTENCSYHVLGALEAAAPRLHLLDRLGYITLPADSVKGLFANPGLVRRVTFRASSRTQFEARVGKLSGPELDEVAALADGLPAPALQGEPDPAKAAVLDAAVDLVDVRHGRDMVDGKAPEADALRQRLLERRAGLRIASPRLAIAPPSRGGPEYGHGSFSMGLGGGGSSADGPLAVLDLRVALHDLIDPPRGFPLRTQLEFFKARLTYAPRPGTLRLDEAWLVEATSLNLFDRFERRVSWKLRVGANRVTDRGCDGCVAGRLEVGGGPAFLTGDGALAAALTGDAELLAGGLQGPWGWPLRPGVGPGLLVRYLAGERLALRGTATWRWLPGAAPTTTFQLLAEARLHLGPTSLGAELRRTPIATEGLLSVIMYGK